MSVTRALAVEDAAELADLVVRERAFLAPFEPRRPESFFTRDGQARLAETLLDSRAAGTALPLVIVDDGAIVGRLTVTSIARGAFCSGALGYWVAQGAGGRGLATAAVADACALAFGPLELHRLEAGTLVDNLASQRVLAKSGFSRYGLAPGFLSIDGAWRDHVLFQRLADDGVPAVAPR
ncbi:GNAT family N-acetyltransferase [Litorihabitans aurantiacus]|uniref:Alanine acetyltransferase n=1 Tax=Litorihabitans aurantiacus TaxID=1930061 RepID=A0AA38CTL8_9MICO|nr:GNAT family protein [Litorihabitans aurantiacus]GMA32906.1 alanine acetyltransferase [Litorihabitans aurantiacus]